MKPSSSHPHLQLPAAARQLSPQPRGAARIPHSALRTPHSASGVALVVTLIMLSVITFMAIAFLVLSRSEHGSVTTDTDQTQARLAAETALQRAIAQALAPMLAQNNEFRYDLMVSTNYINPLGFDPTLGFSATNVNYDYRADHKAFSAQDWAQNIANLWYDPRPPVFINTNQLSSVPSYEFRFFHNLNRNTNNLSPIFDPTGWLAVTNNGVFVGTNWFVGDPQWVGILSSPDRPHAADNRFVSRFAYLAIPVGKTLDHNYIHNQATVILNPQLQMDYTKGADYLRNQGVGTWEGNLAAFLCDLNTNTWDPAADYHYDPINKIATSGTAFIDACSLIRYRYACPLTDLTLNRAKLPSFSDFYPTNQLALVGDGIDDYTAGPLMGATWPPAQDPDQTPSPSRAALPWVGANNTNHYFTPQEYFDPNKTSPEFVGRLTAAGNDTASLYNEYTFYRMLAQLGSDTAGDGGRINLNYRNLDNQGHVVPNMETNFLPWVPEQFFTNTANALLRAYGYNFTITNIPVWPTNFYTPNVHRLLQLAANIYDASTNRLGGMTNLPTVFRPTFRKVLLANGMRQVMIAGYHEATNDIVARFNTHFPGGPPTAVLGYNDDTWIPNYGKADQGDALEPQVLGIPLVIGAKKGLPSFNEYAMQTQVTVSRKLQFRRRGNSDTSDIVETNQMYLLTITNTFGLEAWNSYPRFYPRSLELRMDAVMLAVITNEFGTLLTNAVPFQPLGAPIPANSWLGYGWQNNGAADTTPYSFRAVAQSFLFLTNSMYSDSTHRFLLPGDFERGNGFPVPHWFLSLRPMVRFAMVDTSVVPNRIVDYVSFDGLQVPTDLLPLLTDGGKCGNTYVENGAAGSIWCTNRDRSSVYEPTYGIRNQIAVGLENTPTSTPEQWPVTTDRQKEVDFFRRQFNLGMLYYPEGTFSTTNTFDAPYSPLRSINFEISWQANDPLVHYTIPDLVDLFSSSTKLAGGVPYEMDTPSYLPMSELGGLGFYSNYVVGASTPLNAHYRPWGGKPNEDTSPPTNWRLELKDPLVAQSDNWNFPTNKYPNIGWLGRVHRGTPWQTVYLKSTTNNWTTWRQWSGDTAIAFNYDGSGKTIAMPDAILSLPEGDRAILDLFSTAINDNAARGRLSVNQEGMAAWSAILSGVVVLTNTVKDQLLQNYATKPQLAAQLFSPGTQVIPPAGPFNPTTTATNLWPSLARMVKAINTTRAVHSDYRALWWNYYGTNCWTNTFEHLGDVLAVPELTVASPFLNQGTVKNTFISGADKGNITIQQTVGLSDEMYERIPQQILGLLQCDHTPRFVIYAYGQALRPATHSIYTGSGSTLFQLCTNYQVTAEVATRAVVRIDGAPAHPHAVIENFNVLPHD